MFGRGIEVCSVINIESKIVFEEERQGWEKRSRFPSKGMRKRRGDEESEIDRQKE